MTWLPLAIVAGIAIYLILRWTLGFVIGLDNHTIVTTAFWTSLACVVAYLIDANATSMHGFYRSRLSDAFAVAVSDTVDDAGRATGWPRSCPHRSSTASLNSPVARSRRGTAARRIARAHGT